MLYFIAIYSHFPVIEGLNRESLRWPFPIGVTIRHAIYAMPLVQIQWQRQSLPPRHVTLDHVPNDAQAPYSRPQATHSVSSAADFHFEDAKNGIFTVSLLSLHFKHLMKEKIIIIRTLNSPISSCSFLRTICKYEKMNKNKFGT